MNLQQSFNNLFAKTPLPGELKHQIHGPIADKFSDRPVSVRSSAPGEDSSKTSFAGLWSSVRRSGRS
ncbi:MAG TPA: hypothetical protein ENN79_11520 [Desulfobacteraceae bacterium]|nr:hypothetical protein [Desulfobacteraceae bacterium]